MAPRGLHRWRVANGGPRRAIVLVDRRRLLHDPRNASDSAARRTSRARSAVRMIKLALTGSIGMGKSTVAEMFERAGVPVFDADAAVRKLQGAGGALVDTIGRRFPGTVSDGLLDREHLARIVLEDPRELAALEAIVHP